MLGRLRMSVDQCIKAYEELMESIFGAKAHWWRVSIYANIQAIYNSEKIKQKIEDFLREHGIASDSLFNDGNERNCRVLVADTSPLK